jgi:hypothetical protein
LNERKDKQEKSNSQFVPNANASSIDLEDDTGLEQQLFILLA